jgi:heme exporter protein D
MVEFLNMGGYASYVWSAYGIALIVLVSNVVLPRRSERAVLTELMARFQGDESRDA